MPDLKKEYKQIEISLDIETARLVTVKPALNKVTKDTIPVAYACGLSIWKQDDTFKEAIKNYDKLAFKHVKNDEYKSFWGLDCIAQAFDEIERILKENRHINWYIYNATFDVGYLLPEIVKRFGADSITYERKGNDELIFSRISKRRKFTIEIIDPFQLRKCSLSSLAESFDKDMQKQSISHYEKWMLFNDDGTINKYWYFEDKHTELKDGIAYITEEPIEVKWEEVKEQEEEYLKYDVLLVKLAHIDNLRLKRSIQLDVEEKLGFKLTDTEFQTYQKYKNTIANVGKYTANLFIWHYHRDSQLIRELYWKEQIKNAKTPEQEEEIRKSCIKNGQYVEIKPSKKGTKPDLYKIVCQPSFELHQEQDYEDESNSFTGAYTSGSTTPIWTRSYEYPYALAIDINSMYPAIMSGELPVGNLLDKPPKGNYKAVYLCKLQKKGKKYLWPEWKKEYAFLRQGILGSQPLQSYIRQDIHNYPYILIYSDFYDVIEKMCEYVPEIAGVKYKATYPLLKEVIEHAQIRKTETAVYKNMEEEDPLYMKTYLDHVSIKTSSNSLYGKLCEKMHDDAKCWCQWRERDIPAWMWYQENNKPYKGEIPFEILGGLYVTQMGRTKLLKEVIKLVEAGHKFLYSDTDSIMFAAKRGVDPFKGIDMHNTKIGAWKLEAVFTGFIYPMKSKKYYCYTDPELIIKDEKGIKSIKQFIEKEMGQYLPEGTDPQKIKFRKMAYSGVSRSLIKKIEKAENSHELCYALNNPEENIIIRKSTNKTNKINGKEIIWASDGGSNVKGEYYLPNGEIAERGVEESTGILTKINNKWVIVR